jgi:hypothetical protein
MVHGSFRPNGSSGVVSGATKGKGFSVARTSAGLYTLTFDESYPELVGFSGTARVADSTCTVVQGGDYVAASKTLQVRLLQGGAASGGVGRTVPIDLLSARVVGKTKYATLGMVGSAVLSSSAPSLNTVVGGLAFAKNSSAISYFNCRVPEDWDGASNLGLNLYWHSTAKLDDAVPEAIKWQAVWRKATPGNGALGQVMDHDTAVTVTTTLTANAEVAAKQVYNTQLSIVYNSTNQVIAKGDVVTFAISRATVTNDAASDLVLLGADLQYTTKHLPITVGDRDGTQPYIERVNGATDPTMRLVWPASSRDIVQFAPLQYPTDIDETAVATVRLNMAMAGASDTPTVAVKAFEGVGDTDFGGATAALSSTVGVVTRTLAAADIHAGATTQGLTLGLYPGAHSTDAMYLYSAQLGYTSTETGSTFALADMTADADDEVYFTAIFKNANGAY